MLTKVLTHAKPASAPAASFTSIRSSVPQGNGSFMETPVEQDFSRERLCQPAPSVSVASGSSPEDAANRAADTALARRPAPEYRPAPDTSTESSPSTAPAQLRVRIESIGRLCPHPPEKTWNSASVTIFRVFASRLTAKPIALRADSEHTRSLTEKTSLSPRVNLRSKPRGDGVCSRMSWRM